MTRLSLVLLAVAIASALGTVTAQHRARQLFVELERQREAGRNLANEFGDLRLELGVWGRKAHIENVATNYLHMRVPGPGRVQIVHADPGAKQP